MIIDGHAHACGDYLYADSIIQQLNAHGTDKVVLVPGELNSSRSYSIPNLGRAFPKRNMVMVTNWLTKIVISISGAARQIYAGNAFVYDVASKYPDRIIQFYWVSMLRDNPITELHTDYKKYQFKGVKLHQCWERFRVRSSLFEQIGEFAIDHRLPIFIHPWSKRDVWEIMEYKKKHPELSLIIGHLFGLEEYIRSGTQLDNMYFDISSPALVSSYRLLLALQHVGAERLILGTDVPYGKNNLSQTIDRVKSLPISNEEKELILGQNMEQLLSNAGA